MHVFDEAATREALPFDRLIERLRAMFRTGCEVPSRHVHRVAGEKTEGTVLIMPAWNDRYLGIKTVNVYPGNASRGLPTLSSVYTLFDATTGQPLAQMDGNVITSRRTAASSALAASYLARADAAHLAVLGAGQVASLVALAHASVRPLRRVSVWNRSPAGAERLARELGAQGFAARAVESVEEAVREAHIVSAATLATSPIVRGAWLLPGSHLDLIGSFTPEMREADADALAGARVFVDVEEALAKSGDLLAPMASGAWSRSALAGTLADLCRDRATGRESADGRTVFKSVGTALEDLAAATLVQETRSDGP